MTRTVAARLVPPMLVAGGAVAAAVGLVAAFAPHLVFAPLAGLTSAGFGVYEALVVLAGYAAAVTGWAARRPEGWDSLASTVRRPLADRVPTLARVLAVAVQLMLLLSVARAFRLEHAAFYDMILPLAAGAFLVHHLTPAQERPVVFFGVSVIALVLVFSPSDAFWLLGVGLLILITCHLPLPFAGRVALVVALGAGLAALRAGLGATPWSSAVWPILGSMFMFRLVVYLYDLRHGTAPARLSQRLAYFFMLPNVVFPLFPVVDYGTFRRTWYDAEPHVIYQRGVEWMFRGMVQLVLYRLVYHYVLLPADDVADVTGLARYLIGTILLYLRVSGQFHLIVGILHLFGFHLPETHRRYFLASTFTDFWRRINIYWKDFMMKVFYYPAYFRFRRMGERLALVAATLVVFGATWALHSYQWFWLLGSFPVTPTDILFWSALAGLLIGSALREMARRHRAGRGAPTGWDALWGALRVAGTFVVICILWSLWMSPSVGEWLAVWSAGLGGASAGDTLVVAGLAVVAVGGAAAVTGRDRSRSALAGPRPFWRSCALTAAGTAGLWALGIPSVSQALGPRAAPVLATLRMPGLNTTDAVQLQRGYYEDLVGVNRFNSQLWELYTRRPATDDWPLIWETPAARSTGDYLLYELQPSAHILYIGEPFTTNRWAMRDQEYDLAKAAGTFRIALVGASVDMGWGVGDGETYEALAEALLAANPPPGGPRRYEILNFSVAAYTLPQEMMILDRALAFAPDMVLLPVFDGEMARTLSHLWERSYRKLEAPFEPLRQAARDAGIDSLPDPVSRRRLRGHEGALRTWLYAYFADRVRQAGAVPAVALLPTLEAVRESEIAAHREAAAAAGCVILDMLDAYAGEDQESLRLTAFDWHPNARAHRLLAARFGQALLPVVKTGAAGP